MKPSKFFKAKVVSGYILIVAIFFVSIYYVLQEVERIASLDSDQTELQNKRSFINQTIFHLYQAEGYGQLAVVDPRSYTARYRRALGTVKRDLDSLRNSAEKSGEISQTARLDSILNFLHLKEQSLVNLNRTNYTGSLDELYNKTIEQIIARTDTVPEEEPAPGNLVIREDTVKMAGEKKSFFRRLANAFFPDKKDSVVLVASKVVLDSIPTAPISVADTITGILRNLQGNVNLERQKLADQIRAEIRNISYSNYLISRKINQLLLEFEQQESRRILNKINLQNQIIRHSIYILGIIASLAIVLMLLFVAIIWRDINRNNLYKQELEEANKYNRNLLEAREKLMMAITHDIKAPLSSIMGYLDLLQGVSNKKRADLYINNMRDSSEHLLELVNTLLDFYRLETNKMDLQSVIFNPHRLFETIYRGFLPAAQAKGIDLTYRSTPAADTFVTGDPFHIRQIADNLLSNAIKFTDRGRVSLEAGLNEGKLYFSVSDTGKGMTEEEKNKIFGEFVRLKSAQGVAGSGLGLSIVERLIKLLEGNITVKSKPAEGSIFRVVIPVSPAPEGEPAAEGDIAQPPAVGTRNLHCLLIDDDRFQLELVQNMCEKLGMIAETCQFPEGVPELLAAHAYDIIFTDLQMPALTGFELLALIRKLPGYRDTPVVAISARADETQGEFTAVLHKPFKLQELADIIHSVIRQKPPLPLREGEARSTNVSTEDVTKKMHSPTIYSPDNNKTVRTVSGKTKNTGPEKTAGEPAEREIKFGEDSSLNTAGAINGSEETQILIKESNITNIKNDAKTETETKTKKGTKANEKFGKEIKTKEETGAEARAVKEPKGEIKTNTEIKREDGTDTNIITEKETVLTATVGIKPEAKRRMDGEGAADMETGMEKDTKTDPEAITDAETGRKRFPEAETEKIRSGNMEDSGMGINGKKEEGEAESTGKKETEDRMAEAMKPGTELQEERSEIEERPEIDFRCLTAYAPDDKNAAKQILASFAKEYSRNAGSLRQAAQAGDLETVRRLAHKMLPIFNLLGAKNIVKTLNKLEKYRGGPDAELWREIENTADEIVSITEKAEKEITLH